MDLPLLEFKIMLSFYYSTFSKGFLWFFSFWFFWWKIS